MVLFLLIFSMLKSSSDSKGTLNLKTASFDELIPYSYFVLFLKIIEASSRGSIFLNSNMTLRLCGHFFTL